MPKEKEEKEKPQKQLGEEKQKEPQESKETNQRLNAIETALSRMNAHISDIKADLISALETSNTLLDSIMTFLDQKLTTSAQVQPASDMLQKIKQLFPRDLEEMLSFEESGEYVVVKPRQYLGRDNFGKIAAVIREAGGEYVSQGKQSHFRIRK